MRYRLLAMDLDDTLLDENFMISPRNRQAIQAAAALGVLVTIATGRIFKTTRQYFNELDLNQDAPLIVYHGALIRTAQSGRQIYHQPLDRNLAAAIAGDVEKLGCHANVYVNEQLYVKEENKFSQYYQTIARVEVHVVGPLAPYLEKSGEDPTKLTIIDWDGRIDHTEQFIRERYGEQVTTMQSREFFLEVTDRRSTKGQALKLLAEREGISREQVMAIGDSHNDLDMLKYAGLGVAMANARPSVLQVADMVTGRNVDDGVAQVIEQVILG